MLASRLLHVQFQCGSIRPFCFLPPFTMTTATIDEAVADIAADAAKNKPIASEFYNGVSLGVFANTTTKDDGTEFTRYASKIDVRYQKEGEYA